MRIPRLPTLLLALQLSAAAALAAQPLLPAGPEVRLRRDARAAAAAYAPDGRLLVGFSVPDGAIQGAGFVSYDAVVRFFGRDGAPLGPDIRVHAAQAGIQTLSDLAWSADGTTFAVVWNLRAAADRPREVYWRRFAADGTPLGPEQRAHAPIPNDRFAGRVAAVPGGGWLLAWTSFVERRAVQGGLAPFNNAVARRFRADGRPLGPSFRVTDGPLDSLATSDVVVAPDGTGVVAWGFYGGEETTFDVAARRVGAAGPLGPIRSFRPSAQDWSPSLVMEDDGGFGLVWRDGLTQGIALRRFGPDGAPRGRARTLVRGETLEAAAARLPDGRLVVVWTDIEEFELPAGLSGRVFTADGTPEGPRFQISVAAPQEAYFPRLAVDPDSALAVLWSRRTQTGRSRSAPFFRRLETGGAAALGAGAF